jgi:uncharacterized protein (DUF1786 family)
MIIPLMEIGRCSLPQERKKTAMSTILAMDIGAGTQDILIYEEGIAIENCIKLVLPSRAAVLAGRVEEFTKERASIRLEGTIMGSGFLKSAVKRHIAAGLRVYATSMAAKTFRDNLDEVRSLGIIIDELPEEEIPLLQLTDIDLEPVHRILAYFGRSLPERCLIAVQDHGECLQGSNRQMRFRFWKEFLDSGRPLPTLLFERIPPLFTRMRAAQHQVERSSLMDTGPAALLGSLYDPLVKREEERGALLVNVGNQHVLAAIVRDGSVLGLMEHHTCFMDPARLQALIERFRKGQLTNDEVFAEKGHGCHIREDYLSGLHAGAQPFSFVSVTGPRRHLAAGLGYHMAAPFGDMMLTGCFGLLGAAGILGS